MYICEVNYILTFKSRSYEKQITAQFENLGELVKNTIFVGSV